MRIISEKREKPRKILELFTFCREMVFLSLSACFSAVESIYSKVSMTSYLEPNPQNIETGVHTYELRYEKSGARIRQLRINSGLTQEEVATALNVDRSYYNRLEAGKKGGSIDLFIQLSELFHTSLDYLITGRYLLESADGIQMKEDIEKLIEHLEHFKTFF